MSGIQTWTTPGDGRNWQNMQAHVLFATTNVPTGSAIELCARGNLPYAEWDGGGLLQLPTARPVFNFPKTVSFTYGSWMCERNELDMRYGPSISIGHRFGREGRRQPGIRPPKAPATFTWQIWVKSLNGYEFAEPAWPFEGPPPAPPQPKPGLGGGSGPGDPRECPIAACPDGQGSAGDPINSGTGSFDFTVVDLSLPAAGEPLLFQRTYTSAIGELNGTPLGFGWTHNQDTRLIFADDPGGQPSMVWFKAHSANLYGFSRFDTGTFAPLPGVLANLTREPGTPVTYTLVNSAKAVYTFDEDGNLLTWADAEGNTFAYAYDGERRLERVSAGARNLSFSYDDQDRITQVADQTGRSVSFDYDSAGDLVSATDALGNAWTYAYDDAHHLTQITDPRGVAALRTEYDGDSRAVRQFDGLGNKIADITYNGDRTAEIANARDNVETHTYNDQGLLVSVEDALGGTTTRSYDSTLRIHASTDPGGDPTTFEWSQEGETLLSLVDAEGNQTDYGYDDASNLISSTDARGFTTTFDYSGRLLARMIDALDQTTSYTYSSEGFLESVTDPLGHTTTFANDGFGQRTSMTDADGNTWTYAYDDLGRLTDSTDPLGAVTHVEYDASGHPLRIIQNYDPARPQNDLNQYNITATFTYDEVGNLLTAEDTLGRRISFEYDEANHRIKRTDPTGSATAYAYDAAGNLVEVTDALGRTTLLTYDALNRPVSQTDPLGHETLISYNPDGTLMTSTDALGRVTTYTYDGLKRLVGSTDPAGGVTAYAYDALGNPTSVTDANHHTTATSWDGLNRPVMVTDPNGHTRRFVYDAAGNLSQASDGLGNTTVYAYDSRNLLASVSDPLGNVTTYTYDALGNMTSSTDANGVVTGFEYDRQGRLTAVVQNAVGGSPPDQETNVRTEYGYDAVGNRLTVKDARGNVRAFNYDTLDRLLGAADPLGNTVVFGYDAVGNPTSKTDPLGLTTTLGFDAADRLVKIDYPDPDQDVVFAYDPAGNLTSMTDGVGLTQWTYDALNRPMAITDPFGDSVGYTFDPVGNQTGLIYPDDKAVTYAYDPANRLINVTDWQASLTGYGYDAADRLTTIALPNGVVSSFEYDVANRLTGLNHTLEADVLASYRYDYDGVGNRTQAVEALTYPWTPSLAAASTSSASSGGSLPSSGGRIAFDPLVALMGPMALLVLLPIGRRRARGASQVVLILAVMAGASVALAACLPTPTPTPAPTWTASPTATDTATAFPTDTAVPTDTVVPTDTTVPTDTAVPTDTSTPSPTPTLTPVVVTRTVDYAYDPLYRLIAADYSSGDFFHFTYDPVGNRLTQTTLAGANSYSYDAADRILEADGQPFSWDANGNLVSDGDRTYSYDHADRLSSIVDGLSSATYAYNGLGGRLTQTLGGLTTQYTLDLAVGLTQVLGDGTSEYLYGLGRIGQDGPSGWAYSLSDALGSVRQLTSAAGMVTLGRDFEPFGGTMASAGYGSTAFGFTGEQQDPAGLVFLRARFYDPGTGRFLTKDPFPGLPALPTTLHPYQYALNNPVNLVDPSGQIVPLLIATAAIGGVIGGGVSAAGYILTHPGGSPSDYLNSSCFWKAVGIGAVAGALAGLIPGIAAGAGLIGSGLGGALAGGLLGGAVSGVVAESLSQLWDYGRIVSPRNIVVAGVVGAVVGAAFAGVGYGIGRAISGLSGESSVVPNRFEPIPGSAGASSPDFVGTPSGDLIPIPEGSHGPVPAINAKGFRFEGGSGGHGLDPKTAGVRIMDPTSPGGPFPGYPKGYVSYYNESGGAVNPYIGQTVSKADPWWHIPLK